MSKAEDRALEAYPSTSHYWNAEPDRNAEAREFYKQGYHQAEKDLELGWEDISKIISIDQQVCRVMGISNYTYNHQQAMEEVLKRFQDLKK